LPLRDEGNFPTLTYSKTQPFAFRFGVHPTDATMRDQQLVVQPAHCFPGFTHLAAVAAPRIFSFSP